MGLLSNFIGAAAGAGGDILQRQREADVEVESRKSLAQYTNEIEQKRQEAIMALQQQYRIGDESRAEERAIAGEKRGLSNRATERQSIVDESISNAPRLREVKVEDAKAAKKAEFDPEIQALMRKAETERLTAAEQSKLDFYTNNRSAIRQQTQDHTRDTDTGAALRQVQLESARIKLDMDKADAKIPAAVKGSIAAIQKQVDAKSAALAKAELEGSPQIEAVKKYQDQIDAMNGEIRRLYRPYLGNKAEPDAPVAGKPWEKFGGKSAPEKAPIAKESPVKESQAKEPQEKAYEPPPDSPAGKRKAAMAERERQSNIDEMQNQERAISAYAVALKDPRAALELQSGPLFRYLSREQKAEIFKVVRGN